MVEFNVGDQVRVLVGFYAGQIGTVYAITRGNYPFNVELPNKDVNAYYGEHIEIVRKEVLRNVNV